MAIYKIFSHRPVLVEATQWDGTSEGAIYIVDWVREEGHQKVSYHEPKAIGSATVDARIYLNTSVGRTFAKRGDWIVRGVNNEFYIVKGENFDSSFYPTIQQ